MAATDEEGNIISPLGCFKLVPKPVSTSAAVSRPVSTSVVPRSSPSLSLIPTMVTTTVTTNSASMVSCLSCPAVSKPALGTALTTTTRCSTLLLPPAISPALTAAFIPASVFRSSGQSPAVTLTPCVKGRFTTPPKLPSREALASKDKANNGMIKRLMAVLDDRDTTIARLESEIDSITQRVNKVSTLSNNWVNLVMQLRSQSSSQIQEMRAAITAKDSQLKHQKREITRLSTKVATLTHDNNLAHLALQQTNSIYSPSTSGSVSITGSVFDSTVSDFEPEILKETKSPDVLMPAPTQIARRKEESGQITRMLDSVDKLAKHYSPQHRYHQPCVTNLSQPRSDIVPDSLFNYELAALWMFAKVPTEEEIAQYDRRLEQELRLAPIHSPPLRRPYVNWTTLNKHRRKNLPDPQLFPMSSVPADPSYYTDTTRYKPADQHTVHTYCGPVPLRMTKDECGCVVCVPPFGQKYGLMTDMGIIGMPQEPVHGYCWDDDTGGWVIATGCC